MRTFWTTYLPGPLSPETAEPFLESFHSAKIPETLLLCHDGPDVQGCLDARLGRNVVTYSLDNDGMMLAWKERFADRLAQRPEAVNQFKWLVALLTAMNDFVEVGGINQGSRYAAVIHLTARCRFKTRLVHSVFDRAVKDHPVSVDDAKRPGLICYRLTVQGRDALLRAVEYHMDGLSIDDDSLAVTLRRLYGKSLHADPRLGAAAGP